MVKDHTEITYIRSSQGKSFKPTNISIPGYQDEANMESVD
jgi:hypothetical protein